MTKAELQEIVTREKIKPACYSLEEGEADETLCLIHEHGRWYVYYCERGRRTCDQALGAACAARLLR